MKEENRMNASTVFEKTYRDYLAQLAEIDLEPIAGKLGAGFEGEEIVIPLLNRTYRVSEKKIVDPSGKKPPLDVCVILCKYILMCPETRPKDSAWASFRDFKDSGPLTTYFANDVERAIAGHFSGKRDELEKAAKNMSGYSPNMEVSYDLALQFDLLPRISILLLFNDADDEFPAKSSVLFEKHAELYLDPECLGMAGAFLFSSLKKAMAT